MTKNDFRVTSIFKVIVTICMKNVEFCGKTSKFFSKRCLFIYCIFFNSKTPEELSLVTLVTNYYKFSLLPLVVRPRRKFKKQKLVLNLEFFCVVTSNKLYLRNVIGRLKCTVNKHRTKVLL